MTSTRTPIKNHDEKVDMIEHLNTDHLNDIAQIISTHTSNPFDTATIKDVFEEGCLCEVHHKHQTTDVFIPFTIKGTLQDKMLYLSYNAKIKSGADLNTSKTQFFNVVDNRKMTDNIVQIHICSDKQINAQNPDFAYLFVLKKLEHIKEPKKSSLMNSRWLNKLFLFIIKLSSTERRQKMLASMYKDNRYYTVRQHWQEAGKHHALIDIYIHGDTAGAQWVKSLKAGDVIHSSNEFTGHSEHLLSGQTVLIADETAFPAMAHALDTWQNPVPPHLITISRDAKDQAYFDGLEGAYQSRHKIVASTSIVEDVIAHLETIEQIDGLWGGMESSDAKAIRKYARNERAILAKNNRVSAYWVDKNKT